MYYLRSKISHIPVINKSLSFLAAMFLIVTAFSQIPPNNPDCMPGDGIKTSLTFEDDIIICGYGSSVPLEKIPVVQKIDTAGNTIWKQAYNRGLIGYCHNMLVVDSSLYVISEYDTFVMPQHYQVFELTKHNIYTGAIDWQKDIYSYATSSNGTYIDTYFYNLLSKNDTTLSVLITTELNSAYNWDSHIIEVNSLTGDISLDYSNLGRYYFTNIAVDTNGAYYGIGKDTIFCLYENDLDSVIWKQYVDNTGSKALPGKITLFDDCVVAMTCDPNGAGQILKLQKDNGNILWNTLGNSYYGVIGDYVIDGNMLFLTWNKLTSGGIYSAKIEKVNLLNGTVEWISYHVFASSQGGINYDVGVSNDKAYVTGYGVEWGGHPLREDFWFTYAVSKSSGNEIYFVKILNDTTRNEKYSCGKGVHDFNGVLYNLGHLQDVNQPSPSSSYLEFPMTKLCLLKLDSLGNEINRKFIDMGISPPLPINITDTNLCEGEALLLTSQNYQNWLYEWHINGQPYSNAMDTIVYLDSNSTISFYVDNGVCSLNDAVQINLVHIDTSVNVNQNVLTSLESDSSVHFQWLDCFNGMSALPNDTNQVFYAGVGSYAVEITKNQCIDTSACINLITLSTETIETLNEINIFPNPATEYLRISSDQLNKISIRLYNAEGKLILTTNEQTVPFNCDVSALTEGIYFMEVLDSNHQVQEKTKIVIFK